MPRFGYLAMLLFTAMGSWWLEWAFKIRVLRRIRFTLITIIPIYSQMLGITGPFGIPLEEYLFFIVIPLAIILTYEGVTSLWPHWRDRHKDEATR